LSINTERNKRITFCFSLSSQANVNRFLLNASTTGAKDSFSDDASTSLCLANDSWTLQIVYGPTLQHVTNLTRACFLKDNFTFTKYEQQHKSFITRSG